MKYTVYFDESHIKENGDLKTVCESVNNIDEVKSKVNIHMKQNNLNNDCLYMYKLYEENYDNLDYQGLPESYQLYWENL